MNDIPAGLINGVGVGAVLVILFWMLTTGRLCTGRELREKDKRIANLEEALKHRDEQLDSVVGMYMPAANALMQALHRAAEET